MLNFFLTKKVVVRFILFYSFFTNYLSQKGFCAPSEALGMMSNAMHSLGELEAEVTVKSRSVRMVANLVDDEEGAFKGDHHH